MKNISSLKNALVLGTISLGAFVAAQVQLNQLDGFGVAIYDINNQGQGIHGNGYYDFSTNSSSSTEEGVGQTVAINDAGQVLGLIDDGAGNYIPAFKNGSSWTALTNMDDNYTYTLYDVSENGVYVVGQTSNDAFESWPFIYNIETQTLTVLDSPLYEYGAAYGVNNEGIAVGWMDDLPTGTIRMPAYFQEDGTIVLIQEQYGEANAINENNEIVGVLESAPFIYKITGEELTTYEYPADHHSAAFADISDNGVVTGYAETFIEGQGFFRNAIIFHESLDGIQLLKDVLTENGVDASTLDGIGYRISSDGKYIAGWGSGPAIFAPGWAVYLDDLFTSEPIDYCQPVLDCTDGDLITNVTFESIDNDSTCSPDGYGDYTDQIANVNAGGTYEISVTVGDGWPNESVSVWIDYDNSGTFDENEFTYVGTGTAGPVVGEIAIPGDVAVGQYRMRVRVAAVGAATATWDMACDEDQGYGETEDYTVNVGQLGISDLTSAELSLYPNPVKDVVNISSKKQIQNVSVYNLAGQKVIEKTSLTNNQINVSSLNSGVYVFRVTLQGGQIETVKIIKK